LFKHLPQQRALNKEEKAKAAKLLEMKANKKLVQQQLSQETGNIVLLKDLSNISTANKQRKSRNNLDMTVATLMDKYGMLYMCSWEVKVIFVCTSAVRIETKTEHRIML
jgi:zinc finger SWIM domain-containing protein 3